MDGFMNSLNEYQKVSLVDIMHGIQEQAFLVFSIKADALHGIMPALVIVMQPIDVAYPSLEAVVSITDKEHPTTKELQARISSQLGIKLIVYSSPVKAPT
jgi:hypothetical protein